MNKPPYFKSPELNTILEELFSKLLGDNISIEETDNTNDFESDDPDIEFPPEECQDDTEEDYQDETDTIEDILVEIETIEDSLLECTKKMNSLLECTKKIKSLEDRCKHIEDKLTELEDSTKQTQPYWPWPYPYYPYNPYKPYNPYGPYGPVVTWNHSTTVPDTGSEQLTVSGTGSEQVSYNTCRGTEYDQSSCTRCGTLSDGKTLFNTLKRHIS